MRKKDASSKVYADELAMAQQRQIYWVTPVTIGLAFATGILLALGHHLFYQHLAGSAVPAGDYNAPLVGVSKQQFNIAVGTAFAFLVKSMLSLAVTASYTQVFWRTLGTAKRGIPVDKVDTIFSLVQNILGLFRVSAWHRYWLLICMAWIFWLLPIPFLLTPGTLTIEPAPIQPTPWSSTLVPQMDFINPNFVNFLGMPGGDVEYNGPSELVQRVAAATASRGGILPITPPALNATWSLEFPGPSIQCGNVSGPFRSEILNNTGEWILDTRTTVAYSYFSWLASPSHMLPFTNSTGTMMLNPMSRSWFGNASVIMAFNSDYPIIPTSVLGNVSFDYPGGQPMGEKVQAQGGWPQVLRNYTILQCSLFNSSYNVGFEYSNGAQTIDVTKADASQETIIATAPLLNPGEVQKASYQSIMDAFSVLLRGAVYSLTEVTTSFITQTILTETKELAFLSIQREMYTVFENSSLFHYRQVQPLFGSRGPLADALVQLFENITIGMLSDPYLQPNYSAPGAPSGLANVTFQLYDDIYIYDARTLWFAYGIAIFFTAVIVVIGCTAMWLNGVAYESSFSTVLRASWIYITGTAEDGGGPEVDDGSMPKPAYLTNAIVVMGAASRDPNYPSTPPHDHDEIPLVNHPIGENTS